MKGLSGLIGETGSKLKVILSSSISLLAIHPYEFSLELISHLTWGIDTGDDVSAGQINFSI